MASSPGSVDTNAALSVLKNVDTAFSQLPHIKNIADKSVRIIEIKERVSSNRKLCYQLIDRVATHSTALLTALKRAKQNGSGNVGVKGCEQDLQRYETLLNDIHRDFHGVFPTGVRRILAKINSDEVRDKLRDWLTRLDEFDAILDISRLAGILSRNDSNSNPQPYLRPSVSRLPQATMANLPALLKLIKDGSEAISNVPYVKAIAGVVVQILEIRDQVHSNEDLAHHLIDGVAQRSGTLINVFQQAKEKGDELKLEEDLKYDLEHYQDLLIRIHEELKHCNSSTIARRDDVKNRLEEYSSTLKEFDSIFNISRLTNIEMYVRRIDARLDPAFPSKPSIPRAAPIPPPSNIFTGRDDVLKKVAACFDASSATSEMRRVFVLYGMGGAGKTQIALKFVNDHSKQFSKKYFIDATSSQSLTAAFENISSDLGLSGSTVDATLQWLSSQQKNWLLLFDNADDPSIDLHPYFPACTHGNIIITSRNPEMCQHAPEYNHHVGGLDPGEALLLLITSSRREQSSEETEQARLLVTELGYLALAVVQAGAYIAKSQGMTFEKYRKIYATNRKDLLQRKAIQNSDSYKWSVYTTWETSFKALSPVAAKLLQLSAFWHHDRIPKSVFERAFLSPYHIPEDFVIATKFLQNFTTVTGAWNDFVFQEVINELTSFSLLSPVLEDAYSMHPLVHSWARDRSSLDDQKQDQYCAGYILGMSNRIDERATGIPFWRVILHHIQSWRANHSNSAWKQIHHSLATQFADVYTMNGLWKEAEELHLAAVEMRKRVLGEADPLTLTAMNNLAMTYQDQGRWAESEEVLVEVLKESKKTIGETHPSTLITMDNLALARQEQGRLEEAEELQLTVLERRKKILGEAHFDTLRTMNNLAATYQDQGRWEESEQMQIETIEQYRKTLGEMQFETLTAMNNLAWTRSLQGRLKEAEEMYLVVLERRRRVLGEEHLDTLWTMSNLAGTYQDQEMWVEAEQLLVVALEGYKKVLSGDHRATLDIMNDLGRTCRKQGKLERAEELHLAALEGRRKVLGEGHPDTIAALSCLAGIYQMQARWEKAEESELDVLERARKGLGEDHPDTLSSMSSLAWIYQNQGKLKEAEELQTAVVEGRRRVLGEKHAKTISSMEALADLYEEQGRRKEAWTIRRNIIPIK